MKTVNILGTEYQLVISDSVTDKNLKNADGYCDHSVKKCVIDTLEPELDSLEDLQMRKRHVIRHELIHAFYLNQVLERIHGRLTKRSLIGWQRRFQNGCCL